MYGVVTRNEAETEWDVFDRAFYEVKDVTGRGTDPIPGAVSTVSAFGDNAAEDDADLVPVDDAGNRATREREYFDWSYVCPTAEDYREGLLDLIERASDVSEDVRIDDVGFPRDEYCHCERCERRFEASEYDDRLDWRAGVITDFVTAARERVDGDLSLAVYPDPYPGHLESRSGVALADVAVHVDEVVVPIYDTAYGTTYWLEVIASAFADRLADLPVDYAVELYAADVDVGNLVDATEVAGEYGDNVYFGYDAGNARAVIRRLGAAARDGERFTPE